MKKDITIVAETRASRGKNEARRLRARGLAPGVVYGTGLEPIPVSVNPKELNQILHSATGHNTIFNLTVQGGETTPVMIVDWQRHPLRDTLLHVDLKRIDLTVKIAVKVPVHTKGEPKGVKQQGGLLEAVAREIEIQCLPNDIPEAFEVDVTELMIGQNIRASDLAIPANITLVSSPDTVIAHVIALRHEEEAAAATPAAGEAAPAAAAEPEVIKKGKKEEEGAAAEKEKEKKK